MDKITDSYIDSILRNSQIQVTMSHMSYVMMATLPNGYVVSAVYPIIGEMDTRMENVAQVSCEAQIRRRIREFEAYHLLSMEQMN